MLTAGLTRSFTQDFQLLRPRNQPKLLSLLEQQTYFLSKGSQVQQITFVQQDVFGGFGSPASPQLAPTAYRRAVRAAGRPEARSSIHAKASGVSADSKGRAQSALGFSEIRVTRHLLHAQPDKLGKPRRSPDNPGGDHSVGYRYFVCGPHGIGYQQAYSTIRPCAPRSPPPVALLVPSSRSPCPMAP